MTFLNILSGLFCLIFLVLIVGSFARFGMAIFSGKSRERIRRRPLLHVAWLLASIATLLLLTLSVTDNLQLSRHTKTMQQMSRLAIAIENYQVEYNDPPAGTTNTQIVEELRSDNPRHIDYLSLTDSEIDARGELLDGWKNPFRISLSKNKGLLIQSAGEDGKWDTADDIASKQGP
jgi:hypothetical protein